MKMMEINGIILINKEKGKTSRDMVNELSHIFGMKKIGHTGTLDPIATGVLVMCLGRYTHLVNHLASLTKEYIAEIKVGIKTDTLDITGNIIEERKCDVDINRLNIVCQNLIGKYEQEVPIYSAKKVAGKKLYEYARNNEQVTLPVNIVEIFSIDILDVQNDVIKIKCKVSKGTYIRSLIQSICDNLGIIGTMQNLIRTKQGDFGIENSYTISDVKNNNYTLLKAYNILNYPIYNLNDTSYFKVKNGVPLNIDLKDDYLIMMYQNREIAIYQKSVNNYTMSVMLESQEL